MLTSLIHIVGKKTQRGVDKNKFIIETWLLSILVYFGMLPLKLLFVYMHHSYYRQCVMLCCMCSILKRQVEDNYTINIGHSRWM